MRRAFSFVHAADLHLDSPFRGLTTQVPEIARALRDATFTAFDHLVQLCLDARIDFLVVAGDVFDAAERSVRAQLRFRDGLARLAANGISSFVAFGNHDHLGAWSPAVTWPERVHVFGPDVTTALARRGEAPLAAITGVSYPRQSEPRNLATMLTAATADPADADLFRVAVLHANVGSRPGHDNYAPCTVGDLARGPFDYWALGHVHTREVLCERPYAAFPGNTQGRHINEDGARGCLLVRVDAAGTVSTAFHAVDALRWSTTEVSIEGLVAVDALRGRVAEALEALRADSDGRPLLTRVRLTGRGPLFHDLRTNRALDDVLDSLRDQHVNAAPFVWVDQIEVACRPTIDLAARAASPDLLGEVLRGREELRSGGLDALRTELAALYDHPRVRRILTSAPDDGDLQQWLDAAALACVDGLEGDD